MQLNEGQDRRVLPTRWSADVRGITLVELWRATSGARNQKKEENYVQSPSHFAQGVHLDHQFKQ
jgi:hypothetical protein